jgi:hypothetical protein
MLARRSDDLEVQAGSAEQTIANLATDAIPPKD